MLANALTTLSIFCQQSLDISSNIGGDRLLQSTTDLSTSKADYTREAYEAIQADIVAMFTDSQDFWPADFGNYAPFFIRLAWHCAGEKKNVMVHIVQRTILN